MANMLIIKENFDRVVVLKLNRPEALNALCKDLISALNENLDEAEENPAIGVVILTGNDKAFAAGADVKEMKDLVFPQVSEHDFIAPWERLARFRKPVIAAVAGYALGGGCELAMMCDIILAADSAKFAQPEITLGTIPGAGGTQRLTQLIGKTKAMEMCLTGRMMDAAEAERCGLVTRVIPSAHLMAEAVTLAKKIASYSQPALNMIKEAVRMAESLPLQQGLQFERRLFHSTFALKDRQEGMKAFIEKRPPSFTHN